LLRNFTTGEVQQIAVILQPGESTKIASLITVPKNTTDKMLWQKLQLVNPYN
jgi:hypothetical protein